MVLCTFAAMNVIVVSFFLRNLPYLTDGGRLYSRPPLAGQSQGGRPAARAMTDSVTPICSLSGML